MAAEPFDRVTGALVDAFHISVGAGVLTFQKAQVRRRELSEQLGTYADTTKAQLETVSTRVDDRLKLVEERLGTFETRLEDLFDELEERMPDQVQTLVSQAVDAAKDAQTQVRTLLGNAA